MIASNNLEAEAYDWFLWCFDKCDTHSFHWKNCVDALLKIFFDKEKNVVYKNFVHLKQKGSISEYTHEWEVLATQQRRFTDDNYFKCIDEDLKIIFVQN